LEEYEDNILEFAVDESQVWGCLRVAHYENALDKGLKLNNFYISWIIWYYPVIPMT